MTYWRMQLHPNEQERAAEHAAKSLSAGFVGLDFLQDVGDLERAEKSSLRRSEKCYWGFAHEMKKGDWVLIYAHNFAFALAEIWGPYNYIKTPVPQIGVWFRHFREVRNVRCYSDFRKDAHKWDRSTMTATITPLRREDTASKKLIEAWVATLDLSVTPEI